VARSKRRVRGEGSLRKRPDGRWEGTIYVGHSEDGKARRRSVYGATKQEVSRKLLELRRQQGQGHAGDIPSLTVKMFAQRWLKSRGNVLPDTLYKYSRELQPILDVIGHLNLVDLKARHIRDAYNAMARAGYAVRSQKRAAMHLRSLLRQAVQEEVVTRSVADGVRISTPRVSPVAAVWTPQEVRAFLAVASNDPLYLYFYLLLALGLRSGEVLGLPWRAVDLPGRRLSVYQAVRRVERGSRLVVAEVKTPHPLRTLSLPNDVLGELGGQQKLQASTGRRNELVVATDSGKPVDPTNARRSFGRLTKAAGVPPIRVHDLRHTHASLALAAGVPIEVVSRRLGHASIGITLNTYRHLYEPELQAAALTLDQLLAGRSNGGLQGDAEE